MVEYDGQVSEKNKRDAKKLELLISHLTAKLDTMKLLSQINANAIKVTISTAKRVVTINTPGATINRSTWESTRDFLLDYIKQCN